MRTLVNKRMAECRAANTNISKEDLKLLSTRCIFIVKFYIEIKLSWIRINMIGFFFFIILFSGLHFYNADRIQAVLLNPYPDQDCFRGALTFWCGSGSADPYL